MNKIINKTILVSLIPALLASIFIIPVAKAQASVNFNSLSNEGIKILQIANSTKDAGTANWKNYSVNADPGDVIALLIHYHNFTSGEIAQNTRISVNSPSGSAYSHTVSVSIRADNSSTFSNSVTVNIPSNQSLSFVNGSAKWIPGNQGSTVFPFGQSGNEINTYSGVNIGSVEYGDAQSGYLTLKIQVSNNNNNPPPNDSPSVTTDSVSNITQYSAYLNGSSNSNGSATNAWFEYGTASSNLNNVTSRASVGSGNSNISLNRYVSGLNPNTIYYYRAVAQNSYGTSYGSILNFVTGSDYNSNPGIGCAPIVSTNIASFVTRDSASLKGFVNSRNRYTNAWFEWGTTYALGSRTSSQYVSNSTSNSDIIGYLTNLAPNTNYYFRAVGENDCGREYGITVSFRTEGDYVANLPSGNLPSVNTLSASAISQYSALLRGEVNPNNSDTTTWFEYGTNSNLPSYAITSSLNLGSGNSFRPTSVIPSALAANTDYYYRAVARNAYGTTRGNVLSFRTLTAWIPTPTPTPTPTPSPATKFSVWKETKNLSFPNGTTLINSASIGDTVEYSLYVKNTGSYTLYNVTVTDILPSQFGFVESNPKISRDSSGDALIWNVGSIGSGETKKITFKIKTKSVDESIVIYNSFTAKANGISRTSNKTTLILNPALMAIDISVDKDIANRNESIIYFVRYRNIGIADVDNVVLKVVLPKDIIAENTNPKTYSTNENVLIFNLDRLNKNDFGTVEVMGRVSGDAKSGEELITTVVVDFTDIFNNPQQNISTSVTSSVGSGIFQLAASVANFSIGGLSIWFYLAILLILIFGSSFLYRRHQQKKIFSLRAQ